MRTKLFDSTFLIDYWRGDPGVADYLNRHEDAQFVSTTVNLKEIAVGRAMQGHLDRRDVLGTFDWVRFVPFGVEHAFEASELEAPLRTDVDVHQRAIDSLGTDGLIAAVARDLHAPVVTRNVDHYDRFEAVSVESY